MTEQYADAVYPVNDISRKLHSEELYNVCASPSIVRMSKSLRMRLAGNVESMVRKALSV